MIRRAKIKLAVTVSPFFFTNLVFPATVSGTSPYTIINNGSIIEGTTADEPGIRASTVGSGIVINGKASIISLSQKRMFAAVYVTQGGFIDLGTGTSVTADGGTSGRQPGGIRIQRLDSSPMVLNPGENYNILGKDITVNITGSKYRAISAYNGYIYLSGLTTINGSSLDKNAYSPTQLADTGLEAWKGGVIVVEQLNIKQEGINGITAMLPTSIVVFEGGNINVLEHANLYVIGDNAYGVYANGKGSNVNLNNVDMTVNGVNGISKLLYSNNGTITYYGHLKGLSEGTQYSTGLQVGTNGIINALGSAEMQIKGLGNVYGLQSSGNGMITMRNALISIEGDKKNGDVSAIYIQNTASDPSNTISKISVDRSKLISSGDGVYINGGNAVVDVFNSSILAADYAFNSKSNNGIIANLEINLANSDVVGKSNVENGSKLNLSLRDDSTWNVTDNSSVSSLNNVNSNINFISSLKNTHIQESNNESYNGLILHVNGDYKSDNGSVIINTQLGNDLSPTDQIIIDGDSSGKTTVAINNKNGKGGQTINGIKIITVNGNSEGDFIQKNRIVAGVYDYKLVRGQGINQKDWYLSSSNKESDNPGHDANIRPEASAYGSNIYAANSLFSSTMHDRVGENHYIDSQGEDSVTSMWIRNIGGHNRSTDSSGQNKTQANRFVIQLGGDIASWSSWGKHRWHLGFMAGQASVRGNTRNNKTGYSAKSSLDGYSAGVYATWFEDNLSKMGGYIDSWALYNWFNNSVNGLVLQPENYKSSGVTASLESGYTMKITDFSERNSWYLQPQVQLIWMGVKADRHQEENGTQISGIGDSNIQYRLGGRTYLKGYNQIDTGKNRIFEPFIEVNWIHNSKKFGASFNGYDIYQAGTKNLLEFKTGVESKVNNNVNIWGSVAQNIGAKGYSDTQGVVGVKILF